MTDHANRQETGPTPHHLIPRRRVHGLPAHSGPVGWIGGQQITIHEWNLLNTLTRLDLDPADYTIVGTGALIAYGLPRQITDLDVLVRATAWQQVRTHPDAELSQGTLTGDDVIKLHGGRLEFFATWIDGTAGDELIARSELIPFDDWASRRHLRFASLTDSLDYKKQFNRSKDLADIEAILGLLTPPAPAHPRPPAGGSMT